MVLALAWAVCRVNFGIFPAQRQGQCPDDVFGHIGGQLGRLLGPAQPQHCVGLQHLPGLGQLSLQLGLARHKRLRNVAAGAQLGLDQHTVGRWRQPGQSAIRRTPEGQVGTAWMPNFLASGMPE